MIDRRGFVGNDVLFWVKDYHGYTTNVDKAHVFTEEEAIRKDRGRSTDCAIPLEEVTAAVRKAVDFQYLDRKYFKPTYSYFNENNTENDNELQIKELKRKLDRMEGIFDDMEISKYEYNLDFDTIIEQAKKEAADIVNGKK